MMFIQREAEALTTRTESGFPSRHVGVAIVGVGFSNLGLAIGLKQQGNDDFAVLERDENGRAPGVRRPLVALPMLYRGTASRFTPRRSA